ncbi:zinc finger CW-type PWWP domain protein 1 isoform X2 [Latimeria chalumnae]|uniref:zinc finger CW-type PWWP domain protein 1 isoform X2 n=1 Tax=Latimeria chalumnae TaxID=7897 RepID=UPI0006D91A6C|nr:PREDICTED: zinc finger CW-type PWWP domain protein 1 isoform X3 [Latimeria chalumnae]|eukprot:XP_014346152.1 PREDICTED: zinc finger CW-type PWWP domain protein 1 isoform X3 [Latimeria chalumnae]
MAGLYSSMYRQRGSTVRGKPVGKKGSFVPPVLKAGTTGSERKNEDGPLEKPVPKKPKTGPEAEKRPEAPEAAAQEKTKVRKKKLGENPKKIKDGKVAGGGRHKESEKKGAEKALTVQDTEGELHGDGKQTKKVQLQARCPLSDSQYNELFQSVLQKTLEERMASRKATLGEESLSQNPAGTELTGLDSGLPQPSMDKVVNMQNAGVPVLAPRTTGTESEGKKINKLSLKKRKKEEKTTKVYKEEGRKHSRKGKPRKLNLSETGDQEDPSENETTISHGAAWVQCSRAQCGKWRRLRDSMDPSTLPEDWTCSQNADAEFRSCGAPEEAFSGSEDGIIYTELIPGSLVWARQYGYPWWPGMVEPDPNVGDYLLFTSQLHQMPAKYHITFLGDAVSRAWISASMVKSFQDFPPETTGLKGKTRDYRNQINAAVKMAENAQKINVKERISLFGFASRYTADAESLLSQSSEDEVEEEEEEEEGDQSDTVLSGGSYQGGQIQSGKDEGGAALRSGPADKDLKRRKSKEEKTESKSKSSSHSWKHKSQEPLGSRKSKSVAAQSSKPDKGAGQKDTGGALKAPKKRFTLPRRRSSVEVKPELPVPEAKSQSVIELEPDSYTVQLVQPANSPEPDREAGGATREVVGDTEPTLGSKGGGPSFKELLEDISTRQKEIEEAFSSEDMEILTTGHAGAEEEEGDFSQLMFEE